MNGKPRTFFTRLPSQREKRTFYIAALDCETIGLDGDLALVTSYHEQWQEACAYDTMGQFLDHILFLDPILLRKTIWYSHNGEYDWRYLIEYFRDFDDIYEIRPIERMKGKFFEIGVFSKKELTKTGRPQLVTKFRDSMAVYPQSLKKFTAQFAPEFEKTDIGLSYQNFDKTNSIHVDYAKNDAVGLVHALQRFDELVYENFQVHIKGTTASTAYQAMLRQIPEGEYHNRQRSEDEEFFRKCYYGGRVQINAGSETYYQNVTVFDINSSYPAAMRLGVPKGKATRTINYRPDLPGFYECYAIVPEGVTLPLLPHRNEKHALSFPTGQFHSYLSSLEIDYCLSLGVNIKIVRGYVFEDGLTFCFGDLVDTCESLRTRLKGTAGETVVKLIQNSIYGKFGTKKEGREVVICFDDIPEGYLPITDEETGDMISHAFFRDAERDAEYMLPHYAAWITANARITLDRGMRAAGARDVLYADTDSLHVHGPAVDKMLASGVVGSKYGQYKLEKVLVEVRYHAPKSYTFTLQEKEAEGVQAVYKGIPASLLKPPDESDPNRARKMAERDALAAALHAGEQVEVEFHSSASMQSYLRTGRRFTWRKRKSTLAAKIYSHRIVDGHFRPLHLNEALPGAVTKFRIVRNITEGTRNAI